MLAKKQLRILKTIFHNSFSEVVRTHCSRFLFLVKKGSMRMDCFRKCSGLTCVPGVDDELGHLEGVSLHQPLTVNLHLAGISDLRLSDHDLERTVRNMFPVLLHAHRVFSNFLWCERDPCRQEETFSLLSV